MKKSTLVCAIFAMVLVTGSASAENSLNSGTLGLNISIFPATISFGDTPYAYYDPLIGGKYLVSNDWALLAGFGFSSGGPSGDALTVMRLMGGLRKYLKTDDFAPFIGARFDYVTISTDPATSSQAVSVLAGAEYFLTRQFSVEGDVGFGYRSYSAGGASAVYIGTGTSSVSANFYF